MKKLIIAIVLIVMFVAVFAGCTRNNQPNNPVPTISLLPSFSANPSVTKAPTANVSPVTTVSPGTTGGVSPGVTGGVVSPTATK